MFHCLNEKGVRADRRGGLGFGRRFIAVAAFFSLACGQAVGMAGCPVGDPSVPFCEDFSSSNPLATYTIVNPEGGSRPFAVSVVNQALVFTTTVPGLASAHVISGLPIEYRGTLYEADLRFDTAADIRSVMAITWMTPDLSARMQVALQLDDNLFKLYAHASGVPGNERRVPFNVQPGRTYRVGFRIDEVAGSTPARPVVLGFKGYIDGTLIISETEETLGVDLSALPAHLNPGFQGGSYHYASIPANQVFDNGIVHTDVQFACEGFEPPLDAGSVMVRKNRALPFKMRLTDAQGLPITNLGNVPPVIQVLYAPQSGATADVTDAAVPVGQSTPGNQFVFVDGKWHFNLSTKAYSAPGTYTVTVAPGNGYSIEPTCTGSFVLK